MANLKDYRVEIDGGQGGSEIIEAKSIQSAWTRGCDWAQYGDWPEQGCSISLRVVGLRLDGTESDEEIRGDIDIEPDHDYLIREAGGNPDCDHDWTSEGEGGCRENPGVWSTGGTTMEFHTHCRRCGLHRAETEKGSQRNPGDHDTTFYTQPGSWCSECESEHRNCEAADA